MNCRLCNSKNITFFGRTPIFKAVVSYYECSDCQYLQTEYPYWLPQSYLEPITSTDTGLVSRNLHNTSEVLAALTLLKSRNGTVLDFASGYGLLVRLLRDIGIHAYWHDEYTRNIFAHGFDNPPNDISLVTAFELVEHLVSPLETIQSIFNRSRNLLFSTLLAPVPTPNFSHWPYYGLEHGQHIGFFRYKSLMYISSQTGKYLLSNGSNMHLLTSEPLSYINWRFLRKVAQLTPFLRLRLNSLTQTDYATARTNNQTDK
jgi:hypothetical protein